MNSYPCELLQRYRKCFSAQDLTVLITVVGPEITYEYKGAELESSMNRKINIISRRNFATGSPAMRESSFILVYTSTSTFYVVGENSYTI